MNLTELWRRFEAACTHHYLDASMQVRRKAQLFLVINLIAAIALLANIVIVELILSMDVPSALLELVLVCVICGHIVLLAKGRFQAALWLSFASLSLGMTALAVISPAANAAHQVTKTALLLLPILMYACLVGTRILHVVLLSAAANVLFIINFLWRLMTDPVFQAQADRFSFLTTGLAILVVSGVFASFILRVNTDMLRLAEKELSENLRRSMRLQNAIQASQSGFSIGEQLITASAKARERIQTAKRDLLAVVEETAELKNTVTAVFNESRAISLASEKVHGNMDSQKTEMSAVTESLEEMMRTVDSISETAQAKIHLVNDLISSGKEGMHEMQASVESIRRLADSAKKLLEINRIITTVSAQTNMLAMNAAIEAAHAGDFGRGFHVVAQEIRALSEETGKNTKMIAQVLRQNRQDIDAAIDTNARTAALFSRVTGEVEAVAAALREILSGVKENAQANRGIMTASSQVSAQAETVVQLMSGIDGRIKNGAGQMEEMQGFVQMLSERIARTRDTFEELGAVIQQVHSIGQDNNNKIGELSNEMRSLEGDFR